MLFFDRRMLDVMEGFRVELRNVNCVEVDGGVMVELSSEVNKSLTCDTAVDCLVVFRSRVGIAANWRSH